MVKKVLKLLCSPITLIVAALAFVWQYMQKNQALKDEVAKHKAEKAVNEKVKEYKDAKVKADNAVSNYKSARNAFLRRRGGSNDGGGSAGRGNTSND